MLKQAIIDFYEERDIGLDKLIKFRRPEYLTPGQVEEAAKKLFKRITRGELALEARQMPRWIWRRASRLGGKQYIADRLRFARADGVAATHRERIAELEAEVARLQAEVAYVRDNLDTFGLKKLTLAILKIIFWSPDAFTYTGV